MALTRGSHVRRLGVGVVLLAVGVGVGVWLASNWGPGVSSRNAAGDSIPPPVAERVRVEVLNGGGVEGAARAATRILRDGGFDVVTYLNAENFTDGPSVVLDRVGRRRWAEQVGALLGIPGIRNEPDSTRLLEVTVVLGREWRPEQAPVAVEAPRPWWDLRGYIGGRRR